MANPHKGEVAFDSWDESYKLSFSANALCELEEALGKSVQEISAEFMDPEKFRMKNLRTAFWAGLLDHQPDTDIKTAGRILAGLRAMDAVGLVTKAFAAAFPAEEANADNNPPKPDIPKVPDGTGPGLSTAGAS